MYSYANVHSRNAANLTQTKDPDTEREREAWQRADFHVSRDHQEKYLNNLTPNMQLKVAALMSEAEAAKAAEVTASAAPAEEVDELQKHLEETGRCCSVVMVTGLFASSASHFLGDMTQLVASTTALAGSHRFRFMMSERPA